MSDNLQEIPQEDQELQTELDRLVKYPKLAHWLQLFLDKQNKLGKNTWGNRTQSAIIAYNLDANNPTQYAMASSMGSQNYRKLKVAGTMYYELQGMTATKVLDLIAAHASAKGGKALEMLASITDVYEQKPMIAITNNTQNNSQTIINAAETAEFKAKWKEFLEKE